ISTSRVSVRTSLAPWAASRSSSRDRCDPRPLPRLAGDRGPPRPGRRARLPAPHGRAGLALPLLPVVLRLRRRGPRGPRCAPRRLARRPAPRALPPRWRARHRPRPWTEGLLMYDAFFNAIAWLLAWFYDLPLVGYGGAIALLTITIMVIVTPLNVKATRSMMTMSALAPEMKR